MELNGFYKGLVDNSKSNWLGKTFFASNSSGINNFKKNGKKITKYPFETYRNKNLLILDYNLKENPWWIRRIVDELKEVEKNKFSGKMKIRILPGILIKVGDFKLEKSKL